MSFSQLGIEPALCTTIAQHNIITPTEIQQRAIPPILQGQDVLAAAQTGTGKTAAFGLPIIQHLLHESADAARDVPRALVLVPTRELAQQVYDNLSDYAAGTQIKLAVLYGGTSLKPQTQVLAAGVDIVIATPGRLLDHLFQRHTSLREIRWLVLDEADRMLDMGFMPDIQRILKRLPEQRQTLFFSATFESRIKSLAYRMLNEPLEIQVSTANKTADTVTQMVYPVDKRRKRELLSYLIGSRNWQQALVFVKTRETTDALVKELKLDGIKAAAISGDKSQGARQKALDDFKSGKVRALVATDVAARGIDIDELPVVINYELPFKAEDYVHRIGRTGRAGHDGLAVSLMSRDEEPLLKAVETLLDSRLPQEWLVGFEPSVYEPEANDSRGGRNSRSAEKRKLKAKLKIHQNRGKNSRR
ncbi:DEAD/DEAH box helicase [Vibrio sp. SM6]|uniref:DEAD/DEAH box helicase n=1 Tax=Vibrio agarilyticus TaxID=2726741 RepID=A0A7X8YHK0_9VIBR|nr:DEAD/DEAH box helicase [Vibrio agarilyticus]